MNDKTIACSNCLFFQGICNPTDGLVEKGTCMRYPPKITAANTNQRPKVSLSNWCGEFIHVSFKEDVFDFDLADDDIDELFI